MAKGDMEKAHESAIINGNPSVVVTLNASGKTGKQILPPSRSTKASIPAQSQTKNFMKQLFFLLFYWRDEFRHRSIRNPNPSAGIRFASGPHGRSPHGGRAGIGTASGLQSGSPAVKMGGPSCAVCLKNPTEAPSTINRPNTRRRSTKGCSIIISARFFKSGADNGRSLTSCSEPLMSRRFLGPSNTERLKTFFNKL